MCMYFVYFFQNIFEIFLAKMPYLGTYIDFYQLQNIVVDAICASSLLRGNHYILLYGYNAIEREKAFVFMRYWAHQKRLLWCNSRKSVACQWFFVFVIVIIRWQNCQVSIHCDTRAYIFDIVSVNFQVCTTPAIHCFVSWHFWWIISQWFVMNLWHWEMSPKSLAGMRRFGTHKDRCQTCAHRWYSTSNC